MTTALCILLASGAALLALILGFNVVRPEPPKEKELLRDFYKHRAAFEELKEMFEADQSVALRRVGTFGIVTHRPVFKGKPTAANFPLDRYRQYLRLLHQVGGAQAYRVGHLPGNPTIPIWTGIWLDHRLNIEVVWLEGVPTNQVTNLDACRTPKWDQQLFYRHIDGNWYFETDMRPF